MRVVLDTNVFISGVFWDGNFCSESIDAWRKGIFDIVSSLEIIEELVSTFRHFKIKMPEDFIGDWKSLLLDNAIIVRPEKITVVKDDPDDDKFFSAALGGSAKFIISQDKHLLKIGTYAGIRVLHPSEFVKFIR